MKILRFFQIAALILIAAGAQPAYSALWIWSKSAPANDSIDATINWREGQSPSSVNDSARAMMARVAEYRDDISGLLLGGGTGTAYTVTTNQGLNATPNDGQLLSLRVPADNGINATLRADGGTAFPIVTVSGAGTGTPVSAGTLLAGNPYSFMFSTGLNAWELRDFYGAPLTVPLGGLIPYTLTTVPNSNFVFPAGQCLSTTTYALYWVALGSPASGSCAGGQFRIIDLSGRVPGGLDTMPGFAAANRLTSSATGCGTAMTAVGAICANGTESLTVQTANLPAYTPAGTIANGAVTATGNVATTTVGGAANRVVVGDAPGPAWAGQLGFSQAASTFAGTAQGGTSTPIPRIQPTIGVTYLLRVL